MLKIDPIFLTNLAEEISRPETERRMNYLMSNVMKAAKWLAGSKKEARPTRGSSTASGGGRQSRMIPVTVRTIIIAGQATKLIKSSTMRLTVDVHLNCKKERK